MSSATNSSPPASPTAEPQVPVRSAGRRIWNAAQLPLAVLVAIAAVVYLLWPEGHSEKDSAGPQEVEIVKLVGRHRLTIVPGTPLVQKLKIADVTPQRTSVPLLKVTGSVVARLAPPTAPSSTTTLPEGEGSRASPPPAAPLLAGEGSTVEGRWDFNVPELASAYADWLKARNDVPFYEAQRDNIFKLADANVAAKKDVAERLEKLVTAGTDPIKDLVAAKADLLQSQIQGEKDKHEAQTNVNNAQRTLATLERQLFQAGIDPSLLREDAASMAIVKAEVPELRVNLVHQGDPCAAEFYSIPGTKFTGIVGSVSPTISKDSRTLRVFFQLSDPKGILKPGMYADVGLGTEPRETLRIPADGVLHVGQSDYVLVADGPNQWKVTQVKTGEQMGSYLEILSGLQPGDRVIGAGAILLKPYVVADMQAAADAAIKEREETKDSPLPQGEGQGVRTGPDESKSPSTLAMPSPQPSPGGRGGHP